MKIRLFWLLAFILLILILASCRDGIVLQPIESFPLEKIEAPVEETIPEENFKTVMIKAISTPYVLPVIGSIFLFITMSWLLKIIYRLTTTSP